MKYILLLILFPIIGNSQIRHDIVHPKYNIYKAIILCSDTTIGQMSPYTRDSTIHRYEYIPTISIMGYVVIYQDGIGDPILIKSLDANKKELPFLVWDYNINIK